MKYSNHIEFDVDFEADSDEEADFVRKQMLREVMRAVVYGTSAPEGMKRLVAG